MIFNLEVETSIQIDKSFKWDQCEPTFKTENGMKIYIGKSHKDKTPQVDRHLEEITTEPTVQTSKVIDTTEISNQTESPLSVESFVEKTLIPKTYGRCTC